MDTEEPNHPDPAAELHGRIMRQKLRDLDRDQYRFAVIFHDRGFTNVRIAETLGITTERVAGLLAASGEEPCTECYFGRHDHCLVLSENGTAGVDWCRCDHGENRRI